MINWTKGTDVDPVDRSVDERREQEVVFVYLSQPSIGSFKISCIVVFSCFDTGVD